jgi:elongation factor Ts
MKITVEQIKDLREKTGAGMMECRTALMDAQGDEKMAMEFLKRKGLEIAEKKSDRVVKQGLIEAYSHNAGKVVSVVELLCETDFVARNDEFKALAHELAMQVAAMNPKSVEELLEQVYIRDSSKKISDLLNDIIAKIRENIKIGKIARFELGE